MGAYLNSKNPFGLFSDEASGTYFVDKSSILDELYLVTGQWNDFVDAFVELGYEVEPVVDTTAKLYRLTR